MDHNGRTQTCLIGEDASLHTPGDSQLDAVTCDTAAHGFHCESAADNGSKDSRDRADMHDHDNERTQDIGNGHEGHEFLGDSRDTLDTADDHERCKDHQDDACDISGNGEYLVEVGTDRVDLAHVADTERGDRAEYTEEHCKDRADLLTSGF